MKRTLKILLIAAVIISSAAFFAACGKNDGGGKGKLGTGELTLANYNLLETGKTTPGEARSALGSPTIDQIVNMPIVGASGNMVWTEDGITVTLQFANGKLVQKVQVGLS